MTYQPRNGNNVEKKVLDIMLDHTRIVHDGSKALDDLLDCCKTTGREDFNKTFKKLDQLEAKANVLKKSAVKEIADAGPSLLFRQDLTRISKNIDQVIDLAQGAAFFLKQIDSEWIPPENITTNLQELSKRMIASTKLLIALVRALYQSLDSVIDISEKIEVLENKADANYRAIIIELAKLEAPKGTSEMLRETVDRIENLIDAVRDSSSNIRIYAMSR
ncbi:MAG: DUF47 domain-containing protein [Candidatus Heimdallarchaeota archaeon]